MKRRTRKPAPKPYDPEECNRDLLARGASPRSVARLDTLDTLYRQTKAEIARIVDSRLTAADRKRIATLNARVEKTGTEMTRCMKRILKQTRPPAYARPTAAKGAA